MMRLCYALGYYVIGPLLKWWVRGIELRAHAADILASRGEVAEAPPRCACGAPLTVFHPLPDPPLFDQDAPETPADHFDLWEKELSKR